MIRKAEPGDIDGIIEVLKPFNFRLLAAVDEAPADPDFGTDFVLRNEITVLDLSTAFVAELQGKVAGFCHYKRYAPDRAKTTLLSVPPEYRRQGFGMGLQKARMREAYDAGCRSLMTCCEHPASQAWYKKHFGYQQIGSEPVLHRLYCLAAGGRTAWAIHYGFSQYPEQQVLVCDLAAYFAHSTTCDQE
jgi:N-acetylglutamate synthase-like GNAT family acetyltransferase